MLYVIVLVLVFLVCVAALFAQGLWSNTITLINTVTAALLATNYWEPVAASFEGAMPGGTYCWDFIALWGIFGMSFMILRALTDFISRVRVRFLVSVNFIGGLFMAFWVGWVMLCFSTMTLHTAPLSPSFLAYQKNPESRMFMDLDRNWLAFMQTVSTGSFSKSAPRDKPEKYVFDPEGEFILKYQARRQKLLKLEGLSP